MNVIVHWLSAWGFAHETATHAIRLMLSGVFDRYPNLTVILGHLGEGLPLMLPRLESRLYMQREGVGLGQAKRKVSEYFSDNFYITTSGHFHTKGLLNTISEIGSDRVLFLQTIHMKIWKRLRLGLIKLCSVKMIVKKSGVKMPYGYLIFD